MSWTEWLEDRPMAMSSIRGRCFEWMIDDLSDEVEISEEESEDFDDLQLMGTSLRLAALLGLSVGLYMLVQSSQEQSYA